MSCVINHLGQNGAAAQANAARILVSLELSRHTWLVTVLAPGSEKMSKHSLTGGNGVALLELLARLRAKAEERLGAPVDGILVIQEAGHDGFWIHRLLEKNGIDSHIVEPASIAVSRRHRRAKTDRIDGETLIRTLAAWRRNEPRVCAMVRPPNPEEEDRRRLTRERSTLIKERVQHVNRIKGLLFGQGITDYEPLHRDRRARLETLATGDGRPLPPRLKAEIGRELARIELVCAQIDAVEQQRDALIASMSADPVEPVSVLLGLKGIGPELGARLWLEALFRRFANRRQVAAYAGLAPSPWQSGVTHREQGIAKSGNPRLRHAMVELAWLWLRYQPDSALSAWFRQRVGQGRGWVRRIAIVALARKLLIALWRYTSQGVLPEGAVLKA
jgi:transposase